MDKSLKKLEGLDESLVSRRGMLSDISTKAESSLDKASDRTSQQVRRRVLQGGIVIECRVGLRQY